LLLLLFMVRVHGSFLGSCRLPSLAFAAALVLCASAWQLLLHPASCLSLRASLARCFLAAARHGRGLCSGFVHLQQPPNPEAAQHGADPAPGSDSFAAAAPTTFSKLTIVSASLLGDLAPILTKLVPPAGAPLACLELCDACLAADACSACHTLSSVTSLRLRNLFHGLPARPQLLPNLLTQMPVLQHVHLEEGSGQVASCPAVNQLTSLTSLTWRSSLRELPHGPYLKGKLGLKGKHATNIET
jgi:hypothetical protein